MVARESDEGILVVELRKVKERSHRWRPELETGSGDPFSLRKKKGEAILTPDKDSLEIASPAAAAAGFGRQERERRVALVLDQGKRRLSRGKKCASIRPLYRASGINMDYSSNSMGGSETDLSLLAHGVEVIKKRGAFSNGTAR